MKYVALVLGLFLLWITLTIVVGWSLLHLMAIDAY